MVQDRHYDSDNIRREADVLRNKWSSFHKDIKDYRHSLDSSLTYFTLIEEVSNSVVLCLVFLKIRLDLYLLI